ncbi:hypothetical protein FOH10_25255 [Nocardia otitidiscaviarum]|uniref:YCII-related domain-containing protein n=1 Tax=Nocardia otitidiscaviarum TaxID=1823 RepID=A0A516NRK9_9NOCA|nr:hypothetical protein [Nocardia otitidiscaviarum]MCP9620751.1 hypothetical protein [Nocardia otitidiscaviarum]QDP81539.1 hypothetical protein FOH10_25255 [Nocardia otitidiscaviarum]
MFVVLLRFSARNEAAAQHMGEHNRWIQRGFDDGVFLLVGGLEPGLGGAILAHGTTAEELRRRVAEDPFVIADVVTAEILEIAAARADERLDFLLG